MQPTTQHKPRLYGYDNIKCILIFLVVLAHLMEISAPFAGKDALYKLIYAFHMPVFIFFSGFFARYSSSKIVFHLLYPYLLFQTLYLFFHNYILYPDTPAAFQFTTPYWALWYLLAMVFYYLLIPLLHQQKLWQCFAVFILSIAASIIAGFFNEIGFFLTLSRFFTFLPYFVLGYYTGQHKEQLREYAAKHWTKHVLPGAAGTAAVILVCRFLLQSTAIKSHMMFGSASYANAWYTPQIKLQLFGIGLVWVAFFLFVLAPLLNRNLPLISTIGKNTLPVFLLHGFFLRCAGAVGMFTQSEQGNLLQLVLCTVIILVVLGNTIVAKVFPYMFSGTLLEKLWKNMRERLKK